MKACVGYIYRCKILNSKKVLKIAGTSLFKKEIALSIILDQRFDQNWKAKIYLLQFDFYCESFLLRNELTLHKQTFRPDLMDRQQDTYVYKEPSHSRALFVYKTLRKQDSQANS